MRKPGPVRQQGFGLLSFVIVTTVVALSLVLGYAGILTRKVANELAESEKAYVKDVSNRIAAMYPQYAGRLDSSSGSNISSIADVLRLSGVTLRPIAAAAISNVFTSPAWPQGEGLSYRNIVVYLPADTDSTNPPDLARFRTTGIFASCTDAASECGDRVFHLFSSLDLQREMSRETQLRLNKIASKAQSYFKARMMQDIERNIDVNYFRQPSGDCEVSALDLGCTDTYMPLATVSSAGGLTVTRMARNLSLTDEELFSAWGDPIEATNLLDSETGSTPFTMSFRAQKPAGGHYTLRAVQQL
jgi:hypothetical protein